MSENETPEVVIKPSKPSKLDRVKSGAAVTAMIVLPSAIVAASSIASFKMVKMQLETAKINLETAQLNKL